MQTTRIFHLNRTARFKAALGVLASGAIGVIGWTLVVKHPLPGWTCLLLSALCVPAFTIATIADSRLQFEAFIGNTYTISLDELEKVLNAWLARFGRP